MTRFELLGSIADETRLLVEHETGYSIPIPGHPALAEPPATTPTYGALVLMADQPIDLGFRLDTVPAGMQPQALATALATAYATNRAGQAPPVTPLHGRDLARGATAGARSLYDDRETVTRDGRTMEQLEVSIRPHGDQLLALYFTVRFTVPGVTAVRWANFRAALIGQQHWDPSAPRSIAPSLWPASRFATSDVVMDLTEPEWAEAKAKADDVGLISEGEREAVIRTLLELSNTDAPPTMEVPAFIAARIPSQIREHVSEIAANVLLRNLDQVTSQHDLRAWVWQCIWAIGNRTSVVS